MNDNRAANNAVLAVTAYRYVTDDEVECGDPSGIKAEVPQVARMPLRGVWSPVVMSAGVEVSSGAHAFGIAAVPFFVDVESFQTFAVTGDCSRYTNNVRACLRECHLALNI